MSRNLQIKCLRPGDTKHDILLVKVPRWWHFGDWFAYWSTNRYVNKSISRATRTGSSIYLMCAKCDGIGEYKLLDALSAKDAVYLHQVRCLEGCDG